MILIMVLIRFSVGFTKLSQVLNTGVLKQFVMKHLCHQLVRYRPKEILRSLTGNWKGLDGG